MLAPVPVAENFLREASLVSARLLIPGAIQNGERIRWEAMEGNGPFVSYTEGAPTILWISILIMSQRRSTGKYMDRAEVSYSYQPSGKATLSGWRAQDNRFYATNAPRSVEGFPPLPSRILSALQRSINTDNWYKRIIGALHILYGKGAKVLYTSVCTYKLASKATSNPTSR